MINRLSHSDDLGGVREKVNQIVDLLVFENPMSAIEGVAEKHLKSHNKEIAETRDELKKVLEQVKKETESLQIVKKEIADSIKEIKEDLSKVQQEGNDNTETIRKFITFYSQVGLHVKELCDGKK